MRYLTKSFEQSLIPDLKRIEESIDDEGLSALVTNNGMNDCMMFAVSWLLTMFAHDVENFSVL